MEPVRTTILTSIMAPHRIALFNALASDSRIDLTVVYLARSDPSRQWSAREDEMRFEHLKLRERARIRRGDSFVHVTTGLMRALRRANPEVLVAGGWDQLAYHESRAWCRATGSKFLLWVESNLRDRRDEHPWLRRAKGRMLGSADGVVVPGAASFTYVTSLGAYPARVWVAPNAVDNDLFARPAADRADRTGKPRFLFVGRLESGKGISALLDAWQRLGAVGTLKVIGSGSLTAPVRRRVQASALAGVELVDHLEREALADAYGEADVFVFPSVSDPWGLVINEAMASGLPVIATTAPGAVDDLVIHGENGFVVPTHDPGALADAMAVLAVDRDRRLTMGARSAELIGRYRPSDWAARLADVIDLTRRGET